MAEGKPLSTSDLFLLMIGLYKLKEPPQGVVTGKEYWLKDGALRESEWNLDWFSSPKDAWESVRQRDWLMGNLAANLTGNNQDFSAISEPMLISLDLLTSEIKPGMVNATDAIKQAVFDADSNYERSFLTALTVGLSKGQSRGKDVVLLGAGMRRRTRVWPLSTDTEALQADVEFFVPFYVAPAFGQSADDMFPGARSVCAGIALTRVNGSSVGRDSKGKDLAAVRFNFRIPFTARFSQRYHRDDYELETQFDAPVIEAQKRPWVKDTSKPAAWEKFDDWQKFVEDFCDSPAGGELLNAPIGPLLLEKASYTEVADLFGSKEEDKLKNEFEASKKELKETLKLLKGVWQGEPPDDGEESDEEPDEIAPNASQRLLGGLLMSLGLLAGKAKGGGYEYSLADLDKLTAWDVVNRLFSELDGFPLYVSGIKPGDTGKRMAFALAAQAAENNPKKQFFGLVGLAYDIPVKTAPKKDPEAKDDAKDDAKGGDANETKITLDESLFADYTSFPPLDDEDEQDDAPPPVEEKKEESKDSKKSTVEIRLHLGKWFSGETLEDNWFRRLLPPVKSSESDAPKPRAPLPGIRLLPFQRTHTGEGQNQQATFTLAARADLLSLGFDIKGSTKEGLTFLQLNKGPLAYFGLGAVETRLSLLLSTERVAFGLGVKLKDLRLSFGPKEKKKEGEKKEEKPAGDDILGPLQELLDDDWAVVPAPEAPAEREVRTRLSAKKKDKFSISVGYLSPLSEGSHGTLDIQLYDQKGKRGGMVWIPIDRRLLGVYLKQIGIGLKGVENVELSKGLGEDAKLTVALTGGLRFPVFELGFIGAKLAFSLAEWRPPGFSLDGLDVSFKAGPAIVSGSFLKSGFEYAGLLTIDLPKLSIGAMGYYGSIQVFKMKPEPEVVKDLRRGRIHADLSAKLKKSEIKPLDTNAILQGLADGNWQLVTDEGKRYDITYEDGNLHVLSPDKTLFIYGMVNAAAGSAGLRVGPIEITGFALGFGLHREVKVPRVEEVAEFPLVKMVMGTGGYQEDGTTLNQQLGKPVEDPVSVLEDMEDWLPAKQGQYFICGGLRFTVASAVDCFALMIVQWGNDFELTLLGLARFRHPRDVSAKAICYIEMQVLMSVKPSEGSFKLQALLTSNSWVINEDCKLTGGLAVYVWFGGAHKDDFVVTLGGYHPRFARPDHYPIVPRLGLNWPVTSELSIKGGAYLAVTPSCIMLGAKLEAFFQSGRLSVWFTAHLDALVAWSPFHFEVDIGISLRAEFETMVYTVKVTIAATVQMWGPPTGGIVHVDLTVISRDIPFGATREEAKPQLIESWAQFARSFLNASDADKIAYEESIDVSYLARPNLVSGRYNANKPAGPARENAAWKVRADELELAASTAVPVTTLKVGTVKPGGQSVGVQERSPGGKSLLVTSPVALDETKKQHVKPYHGALGVRPMGKGLQSVLTVTMVRDEVATEPVDLTDWTVEEETGSLPAALWDTGKPDPRGPSEPSSKLIPNCITGVKRLKPPAGQFGQRVEFTDITWTALQRTPVAKSDESQELPSKTRPRNVQTAVGDKQAEQKQVAGALAAVGFTLAWQSPQAAVRFRELQAEPLAGAVV